MKKILKWTGLAILGLIIIMVIYALFGMQKTLNAEISSVDLNSIPDGVYSGSYECYRWSNTVTVTVQNHQITYIAPVKIPQGRDSITEALIEKILDRQTPDVDTVSGATASSNGFLKAVENALQNTGG